MTDHTTDQSQTETDNISSDNVLANPLVTNEAQVLQTILKMLGNAIQARDYGGGPDYRLTFTQRINDAASDFRDDNEGLTSNQIRSIFFEAVFAVIREQPIEPNIGKVLLQKAALYGHKPIRRWGPIGVIIRISSKWDRFQNLQNQKLTVHAKTLQTFNESIDDTLMDIVGYAVLGWLLCDEIQAYKDGLTEVAP